MEKLIEEINKIINKVNDKLPEGLSGSDAEEILEEINGDLRKVKRSAETEKKETIVQKIDEIRKGVNKRLGETLNLAKTQDALNEIKTGLEEVKKEIRRLEEKEKESLKVPATGGSRSGRTSPSIIDVSKDVRDMTTTYVKTGVESSNIPILKEIGGLFGLATGAYHGTIETGAHFFEKGIDEAADFADKGIDIGAKVYEDTRKGAQDVTQQVIGESADVTKKVIENFNVLGAGKDIADTLTKGIGETERIKAKADSDARIAEANAKAEVAKAEAQAKALEAQARILEAQIQLQQSKK